MDRYYEQLAQTTAEEVRDMSPKVDSVYNAVFDRDKRNRVQTIWDTLFGPMGTNGMSKKVEAHDKFITRLQAWLVLLPFAGTLVGGIVLQYVIPAIIHLLKGG